MLHVVPKLQVYQLKVTLQEIHPPIWRRFLVRGDVTVERLHLILQIVMGWENEHLYKFTIGDRAYSDPDAALEGVEPPTVKLHSVAREPKMRFEYVYDFGDNWRHQLIVEDIIPVKEGQAYPVCLAGQRASPPEDIGGIPGYEEMLDTLAGSRTKKRRELLTWLGRDFDPEEFDVEAVNAGLRDVR